MKQRDIVELVAGFVSIGLLGGIAGNLGSMFGWSREIGTIVLAGLSGFTMSELYRRIKRRRTR